MLIYATLILGLLVLFSRLRLKMVGTYLVTGVFLWYFILKSGIHPTIAGVLLALLIPRELTGKMEHLLHKPVNYIILPLFALANTAIPLSFEGNVSAFSGLSLGIVVGLFIGKPLGIILFSYAGVRSGRARLPQKTTWSMVLGVGLIAGIGFTMSIFIASLSFGEAAMLNIAKLSIIVGSLLSALAGFLVFYLKGR